MSELIGKYTMLHAWEVVSQARTMSYGITTVCVGYDTSYSKVGSRISSTWLDERLAIL